MARRAHLKIPRQKVRELLQGRIEEAINIAPIKDIKSPDDLAKAEVREDRWRKYNRELLTRALTTYEYADEYASSRVLVHQLEDRYFDPSFPTLVSRLVTSVEKQKASLASIIERLDLIEEDSTIEMTKTTHETVQSMPPVSESKVVQAHCPTCGGGRNAHVICEHVEGWTDQEDGISGANTYRILKCGGCGTVYFERSTENDSDMIPTGADFDGYPTYEPRVHRRYWPSASRRMRPAWVGDVPEIDITLSNLLNETYDALNEDLNVLSATGMRTVFDRASELLNVDPAVSFDAKLSQLQEHGHIGGQEREALNVLVDAGSAAAHRGWHPSHDQLATMMSILENFIQRAFFVTSAAGALKAKVPERPRRR